MRVIQEELNRIAEEICDEYCKHRERYTQEKWDELLEDGELPCNVCPLLKITT